MNKYERKTKQEGIVKGIRPEIIIEGIRNESKWEEIIIVRNIDFSINGLSTENHLRSQRTPKPFKIRVNIIIIIILESAVQGRERVRTLYQSKDPNPTQPTHGRKKKIKQ